MNSYWLTVRTHWRSLLALLIVFELLAFLLLLILPKRYETSATIAASEFSVSYSPEQSTGLGALSSLSMLNNKDRPPSLFSQYQALMKSTTVAQRLLRDPAVLAPFYDDAWDPQQHAWKQPSGPLFAIQEGIKSALGLRPWQPPDAFRVAELLSKNVVALQNSDGMVEVSVLVKHPEEGDRLLNAILDNTAIVVRQSVEGGLQRQISYMDTLLKDTDGLAARQAQTTLVTEAQRKIILIRSGSPIGAQIIEPVGTDPKPASPKPSLLLGFCALVAVVLYVLLVLFLVGRADLSERLLAREKTFWFRRQSRMDPSGRASADENGWTR